MGSTTNVCDKCLRENCSCGTKKLHISTMSPDEVHNDTNATSAIETKENEIKNEEYIDEDPVNDDDGQISSYDFICNQCGNGYNRPRRFNCYEKDFCSMICLKMKCDPLQEERLKREKEHVSKARRLPK